MRPKLEVYISDDCPTCVQTKNLLGTAAKRYTQLEIDLINLSDPNAICPDRVFAVPTFMYNERIIFLGNPSLQELDDLFLKSLDPEGCKP
ncbi:MAG: thioredoxin family protein [Chloroflexota bacterium]